MTKNQKGPASSSYHSYRPSGPNSRCREKIMRAQAVLAADDDSSLSRVSVSELERAVSAFLAEARVPQQGGFSGGTSSRSGRERTRESGREVKQRLADRAKLKARQQAALKTMHPE